MTGCRARTPGPNAPVRSTASTSSSRAPDAASSPAQSKSRRNIDCAGGQAGRGIIESAMSALPLVFDAPRRGKPPAHLADLDSDGRRAAVTALGLPGFRADQLSRHYFTRFESDPASMTDLPAALREQVGATLMPPLLRE